MSEGFNLLTPEEVQKKYPGFPKSKASLKIIEDTKSFLISAQEYIMSLISYIKSESNIHLF